MKRRSELEWSGSCLVIESGSPKALAASNEPTRCFRRFEMSFLESHSKLSNSHHQIFCRDIRMAAWQRLVWAALVVCRTAVVPEGKDAPSGPTRKNPARAQFPLAFRLPRRILNHMVQYTQTRLDASFAALSDATRRGVLEQLCRSDASITDLAEKFDMTLTGMKKHVGILELAGLVTTKKIGRVRRCQLGPRPLQDATAWLERYRRRWDERFDELDKVVEELTRKEMSDERKHRK